MAQICKIYSISRQSYYKGIKRQAEQKLKEVIILEMVQNIRKQMPRIGSKKLYILLTQEMDFGQLNIGRDAFMDILRANGLFVKRKRQYAKTTDSSHRFKVYGNLIKGMSVTKKDEVYVSDITYIRTKEKFGYLALVTDLYSRKIVGFDFSDSLALEGSVRALKMSLKGKTITDLTHHSDRGIQYCSNVYIEILKKNHIKISMSEKGNPYENAVAERVNGILKEEFGLSETFKTLKMAKKAIIEAIRIYNELRPHMNINMLTPNKKYAA